MTALLLNISLGFAIGASLGLLGGGGSILTVPALVYLVGQSPHIAVTTSLAIVGANSALGAAFHRTRGTLNWHVALLFGGSGMIISYFAAGLSKHFSPDLLMVAFATLMLLIGGLLLTRKSPQKNDESEFHLSLWKIVVSGAVVGLLTGILGVGGGFLIVPALVMLVGLPMHHAVGTSLVIIAMNSLAGFMGHISGMSLDMTLVSVFVAAGIAGTFAGTKLNAYLNPNILRQMFAVFVMGLALFLMIDNLPKVL